MPYAYQGDNCYRRGDYYRGDYYRGDPGFLSSVGKLAAGALKIVAAPFNPAAAIGLGMSLFKPSVRQGTALAPMPKGQLPTFAGPTQIALGGFGGMNIMAPPPGGYVSPAGAQAVAMAKACGVKGVHANKSTYITRGGGTSHWPQELIVHAKGSECVRIRRMNVANPRALRRSLRRLSGFAKLARRVLHFTSPRAARGRPAFRFKRRRRAA